MNQTIRPRVRDAILQALAAGVVPGQGIQHIQVGRDAELNALIRDIERIGDEGSAFRLIVGEYGSGKTFFLHVVSQVALEQQLVTISADLSPERRLVSSKGQARNLYSELISSLATRSRPNGGALDAVIQKFVAGALKTAGTTGQSIESVIEAALAPLRSYVGGYDMVRVLTAYCLGHESGNTEQKSAAMRWLRGEYTTITEARKDLGVRSIVDDTKFYDAIRLMAEFVVIAGYKGLFMILDEAVNLFKISHAVARTANYEMVLRILNSTLQGEAKHLGVIFGVTPEALYDARRGLCSYDALNSRLAPNAFAERAGLTDYNQPTIQLQSLTPEELFVLLQNITAVFAAGQADRAPLIDDAGIQAFMTHCNETIGAAYYKTPRETIRSFTQLLFLLEQHPDQRWSDHIEALHVTADQAPDLPDIDDPDDAVRPPTQDADDDLSSFKL
jgi:hypothetical protein